MLATIAFRTQPGECQTGKSRVVDWSECRSVVDVITDNLLLILKSGRQCCNGSKILPLRKIKCVQCTINWNECDKFINSSLVTCKLGPFRWWVLRISNAVLPLWYINNPFLQKSCVKVCLVLWKNCVWIKICDFSQDFMVRHVCFVRLCGSKTGELWTVHVPY